MIEDCKVILCHAIHVLWHLNFFASLCPFQAAMRFRSTTPPPTGTPRNSRTAATATQPVKAENAEQMIGLSLPCVPLRPEKQEGPGIQH